MKTLRATACTVLDVLKAGAGGSWAEKMTTSDRFEIVFVLPVAELGMNPCMTRQCFHERGCALRVNLF